MRIITFQSKEVVDSILKDGVYYANPDLSREMRDYKLDIAQLGGSNPIWGLVL